jgi:hypothetical protein
MPNPAELGQRVGEYIRRTRVRKVRFENCDFPGWRDDWGAQSLTPSTLAMSEETREMIGGDHASLHTVHI